MFCYSMNEPDQEKAMNLLDEAGIRYEMNCCGEILIKSPDAGDASVMFDLAGIKYEEYGI